MQRIFCLHMPVTQGLPTNPELKLVEDGLLLVTEYSYIRHRIRIFKSATYSQIHLLNRVRLSIDDVG